MHDPHPRDEADAASRTAERAMEPRLLVEERRRRICDLLQESGRVTVVDLARRFVTSTVTIRADLAALERIGALVRSHGGALLPRSEEHTSELQSHVNLVCRLLLEKKN